MFNLFKNGKFELRFIKDEPKKDVFTAEDLSKKLEPKEEQSIDLVELTVAVAVCTVSVMTAGFIFQTASRVTKYAIDKKMMELRNV